MLEARYFEAKEQGMTVCRLCPRDCSIGEGKNGFCRTRTNQGGILYAENYGECTSSAIDPIEKKPLYHFYPGSWILSLGSWGCNFTCRFCQNWHIAQQKPSTVPLSPKEVAEQAQRVDKRNIGVAYTYSEPGVWYEFVLETAKEVKQRGFKNVLVTNGFLNKEPLLELMPYIDAFNIDVKAFNETFYSDLCSGWLSAVKQTVELAVRAAHVEITCLVIPGHNDNLSELEDLAKWLAELDRDIPLHFSRYFPNYKMDIPPTPHSTLEAAYQAAKKHLNYVYLGNTGKQGANTFCPQCETLVIDRMHARSYLTGNNQCPTCGESIAVVGTTAF
ncbi:MAG: Radical domain protein [Firmicutes bacterium]|nr:Radical domain protein [Bacillota bacterium]